MDTLQEKAVFRPISRSVQLEGQVYQIFDPNLANIRADVYLQEALSLLALDSSSQDQINHKLLVATDHGSADAPYLFALRILQDRLTGGYSGIDAVILLGLAAERGNKQASYYLGCCYAGRPDFPELLTQASVFFDEIDAQDRKVLAEYYLSQSME